ncbi:hypothetical protein GCM10018780_17440 [Streptomyces lanatus]|nr:hypothetical protein GCM10018780_17440 [Streptomyces lanatus]
MRAIVAVGVGAGVLMPCIAAAAPADAMAAPTVRCSSDDDDLAERLRKDITAALAHRDSTVAVGLHDRATDTTCTLRPLAGYDSASIIKVTVLAALLWDAKRHDRFLTRREAALSKVMIVKSENAATRTLWKQLGMRTVKGFLKAAGMTRTWPGANGYWGLTRIIVTDEQKLLRLLTTRNAVLSDNSRGYILRLMRQVVPSQRWGTPYGVPSGVSVAVKNGWLRRDAHGWRVHSVGVFKGRGHDYTVTVLTHGNRDMKYGVNSIQRIAKVIHRDLAAS